MHACNLNFLRIFALERASVHAQRSVAYAIWTRACKHACILEFSLVLERVHVMTHACIFNVPMMSAGVPECMQAIWNFLPWSMRASIHIDSPRGTPLDFLFQTLQGFKYLTSECIVREARTKTNLL